MGAAILLMIAYAGRCPFERMALTSPMIGIAGVTGRPRVQLLIEALDAIGLGGAFAPGGNARPSGLGPFENNVWTSDPVRYARWASALRADASVGVGWPTVGWLLAAIRLTRQFEDFDYPRSILTPTLVFAAGKDRVADTGACERFAERLRAGRLSSSTAPNTRSSSNAISSATSSGRPSTPSFPAPREETRADARSRHPAGGRDPRGLLRSRGWR